MDDILASQSEESLLKALESLRLKLYLDPEIAKAKLVEGAKELVESDWQYRKPTNE